MSFIIEILQYHQFCVVVFENYGHLVTEMDE